MFDALTTKTADGRVDTLDTLVMGEQAIRFEVLTEIARLDTTETWKQDGATSMADWLVGRYTISIATAREWVKVARTLESQPNVRGAYAAGRLSWDQLRALLRFTTPDNEAEWAERAPSMTVAELRAVRKTVTSARVVEAHEQRWVSWWFDDDRPGFHMTVDMADIEGATVATWLARRANQYDPDSQSGVYEAFEARCADALYELASQDLASDRDHDRATILVHTDLMSLLDRVGAATIADGPALADDTLQRLACDARIQLAVADPDQTVIGVGRTTRTIPPWLNRLVRARDKGCRFPNCRRTRWVQVHHIIHWADGGPTDLDNLMTLCGFHHRLIHEHGWTVKGDPNGTISWWYPSGSTFEPQAPARPLDQWKHILNLMLPVRPPDRPAPAWYPLQH